MTAAPSPAPVPLTLVTGALGAGKTTLVQRWLRQRPAAARWAVVVNEFGALGVDAALLPGVEVYDVSGGCACCAARVTMQATLARVLRDGRAGNGWAHVVVELSGLGHPGPLLDQLRAAPFAGRFGPIAVVHVLDAGAAAAARPGLGVLQAELARQQLDGADVVAVNRLSALAAQARAAWLDALRIAPFGERAVLEVEALEAPPAAAPAALAPVAPAWVGPPGAEVIFDAVRPFAGEGWRLLRALRVPAAVPAGSADAPPGEASVQASLAWWLPPAGRFSRRRWESWLATLPGELPMVRGKAVVHTLRDWILWQWLDGGSSRESSGWRRDSRVELLLAVPAASSLELLSRLEGWGEQLSSGLLATLDEVSQPAADPAAGGGRIPQSG